MANFSDDTVFAAMSLLAFPVVPVFIACILGTSHFLKSNNLTEKVSDIIKIFIGTLASIIYGICAISVLFYVFATFSVSTIIVGIILFSMSASLFYASTCGTLEAIREFK